MKTFKAIISVILVCVMLLPISPVASASNGISEDIGSSFSDAQEKLEGVGATILAIIAAPFWVPLFLIALSALSGDTENRDKWLKIYNFLNPLLRIQVQV